MHSRSAIRVFGVWAICTSTPLGAIECCGSSVVLATSGFNDALGIHANPTPNSPFQIGVTVDGQGVGEPGWDTPWQRLGGFEDRAPVSNEFVYEGDGAVKLFADNVFGTAFERAWFDIVPVVRIDAYVLVRPSASMRGNAVHTTMGGEIPARTAAYWEIMSNGDIRVFQTSLNQSISTGFSTLPNQWNKYSLVLNSSNQTWKFYFNDQLFHTAQPLTYLNPTNFIDRANFQAQGTLTSYVDAVTVSVVPIDYERNGIINAGDYDFWRAHYGDASGIGLQADGSGNGITDAADYVLWRDNFTGVVGAQAVIPEPSSFVLAVVVLLKLLDNRVRTLYDRSF